MNDELKAACLRCRRLQAGETITQVYGDDSAAYAQSDSDAWKLACAYLAEHPADDDEPLISAEQYVRIGANQERERITAVLRKRLAILQQPPNSGGWIRSDEIAAIAAELGITLEKK